MLCREGYLESIPKKGLFVRQTAKLPPAPAIEWRTLVVLIPPGASRRALNSLMPIFTGGIDSLAWRMEFVNIPEDYCRQGGFPFAESVIARRPASVIWLFPDPADMLMVRYMVASGIAVVTYNRDFTSTGAIGVIADVQDAVHQMFDELWKLKKRRFAVISVDRPSPSINQFRQTATRLVHEHGLGADFRDLLLPHHESDEPTPEMLRRIAQLMDSPDRPDAILCAEQYSLWGVELWLSQHRDVRIPEDLALASFDRVERHHTVRLLPNIPCAEMDHSRMLQVAMGMIEQQLAGRRVDPKLAVVPALMIRKGSPAAQRP